MSLHAVYRVGRVVTDEHAGRAANPPGARHSGHGSTNGDMRPRRKGGRHEGRRRRRYAAWLLVIPLVAPLLSPLTNSQHPQLWGIPFFYWYQMLCALLAIAVITAVFLRSGSRG